MHVLNKQFDREKSRTVAHTKSFEGARRGWNAGDVGGIVQEFGVKSSESTKSLADNGGLPFQNRIE